MKLKYLLIGMNRSHDEIIRIQINQRKQKTTIKMKIKDTYEYQFPSYALPALINGDYDGLEDEDIKLLDNFIKANSHIDVWEDKEIDQEPYFTHYPEFGLACNVVDLVGIEFEK